MFAGNSFGLLLHCMLQITVNIVQVEVLYLFFFTYLYVLVKIRQLNFKRSFYYFEYSDRTKTVAFSSYIQ